jgi:putative transposase
MVSIRKIVFANNYYYHIFNRGIDKRITFNNSREYQRALELLYFYQFADIPLRFSHYVRLPDDKQKECQQRMIESGKIVEIIAYSLMTNHFHLLLKQKQDNGISIYTANFINAYTKYFNIKHERAGALFQGVFQATYIEDDEQLIHLTRYIHLNPVVSSLIKENELSQYHWSSYTGYVSNKGDSLVSSESISEIIKQIGDYEKFTLEQIPYAKKLNKIKHHIFE